MSLLLRHFHQKPRAKLHESSTNCVPLAFYSLVPWNHALGGGGERTHKFSLFYSQRLVYIRNKRGKREKERETVFGWSKQRRENTGEETQRRTNVSWRGRKPRREARARGHLPLSPLSLSLVRSTFAQPYRPPFKSSLFPVALNFPPWKTSLVEGNRTF